MARANKLQEQAAFDDVLMRAGIVQHYLPVRSVRGQAREMGIDVWLSLEAYDLAVHGRYDVGAFVVCDSDDLPLLRKLTAIGVRSLLLAREFSYEFADNQEGLRRKETRTAQALIRSATYPLAMTEIVEEGLAKGDAMVEALFVSD